MNCKPGDLAIIVHSKSGNEGKIVRIVQWIGKIPNWAGEDRWEINGAMLNSIYNNPHQHARDCNLRPLNPPSETESTEEERVMSDE